MENKKKTQKQRDSLIAQSNDLVRAKYSTSLWERRLFIEMIQTIEQQDSEFKWITLYYSDLINTYEGNSNRDYERITKAAKSLGHKVMFLPFMDNGEEREISHAVVQVNVPKNLDDGYRKYIKLKFNDDLKPLLLKLEKNYFLYNKANIIGIKKKYTFDFYELFKQLEREDKNTTKVYFSIDEFREHFLVDAFGNPTKQYKKFSDIERYVIQPSRKEMREQTDLSFDYDKQKKGRKIIGITFTAYKNRKPKKKKEPQQLALEIPETTASQPTQKQKSQPQQPIQKAPQPQPTTAEAPAFNDPIHNDQAYQKLVDIGVAIPTAYELVNKHDKSYILTSIKEAQQAHQISPKTNFAGFVVSCIKRGTYKGIQQKKQAKKTKEQARQKRQTAHYQIMDIRNKYYDERKKYIKEFRSQLDEKTTTEIIKKARDEHKQAKGMTDKGIQEGMYFDFGLVSYFKEKGKFPTEFVSFDNYMQERWNVKVSNDNNDGWYEVVG